MTRQERIEQRLAQALQPVSLSVVNESHKHKGHGGDDGSGETHFYIEIVSDSFQNISRVACQRMVNDLLEGEFKTGLHALSLRLSAPLKS